MKTLKLFFCVVSILLTTNVLAQIPAGYYDSAQGQSGTALKTALYNIINGHTEYPYTSSSTDTWDILKEADRDPNNPNNVIGIYSGFSMNGPAEYDGGNGWSREHIWAQSRGGLGTSLGPGTDCHHLRVEDVSTNSARGNLNFAESTTQYIDLSGQYSGTTQSYIGPGDTWEPRAEVKGDVARMIFYMATRYEGENGEPDLELTENLLSQGDTSPLHGRLSDLLLWHVQDPVDAAEMTRNNIIYSYQNNRNPFIDHPEYVALIWGPAPNVPFFTSAPVTTATEDITYTYNITTDGGQASRTLSVPTLPAWLGFSNSGNGNGTITGTPTIAQVGSHNVVLEVTDGTDIVTQSFSIIVSAAGGGSGGSDVVFINEIHYDNSGSDQGEGVELAGSAGMDLSGWSLELYNGSGGSVYNTTNLSGVFTDQNNGFGFMSFMISGMQNGAPDGIALVDDQGQVVQFLSYEGTLTASDGPANGMQSTDIGQSETSGTQVGFSLQLSGTGSAYSDFNWSNAATATFGGINNNQTFVGNTNQHPAVSVTGPADGQDFSTLDAVNITATASDPDGTITQVEFFVNGVSIGTDTTSPYSSSWVIPNWGAYAITAVATDNNAATSTSGAVNITATQPNQNPAVSVTGPADGQDFSTLDAVNITATASDPDGSVTQVEFFVDGVSIGTDTTSPYSSSWVIPNWGVYAITAVATDNNAATTISGAVNITATQPAQGNATVFINEIHYDNSGTDTGEGIELAGNTGTNLAGWSLVLYNGSSGTVYNTTNLSGAFTDQNNGFGFISFTISDMQNGAPDGVALVDDQSEVVQFLSYEGTFTASDGPANGMQSTDIGQSETSGTQTGFSLQLSGTGSNYSDFSWAGEASNTFGTINNLQSFGGTPPNQLPTISVSIPADGADFSSLDPINISANASDPDGTVTQVEFFVDGVSIGIDTTFPYSTSWVIPNWGAYVITAVATDDAAATTASAAVNITATDPNPPGGITIEHGTVPNVGSGWQTINLQNSYTSMVVVATVHLPDGGTPAVSRIRNASGSSFEVRVQSPSGAALNGYSIQYLVVEEGVYTTGTGGVNMEAIKVTSTATAGKNNWVFESRSYQNAYSSPVVIGQVMTANDDNWSVFWASASGSRTSPPNASGFSAGKHVGEDSNGSRVNETLGYIVLEAGSGTINGVDYSAGLGSDIVRGIGNSSSGYTYNISGLSTASEAMLSAAALDGGDGGWPVLTTNAPVSASSIRVGYDEDQVSDSERNHTTEQVSYLVLGTSGVSAKPSTVTEGPEVNDVTISEAETRVNSYPNPFTHDLNIGITSAFVGEVNIAIYDRSGKLMYSGMHYKNETDTNILLETAHLSAGLYIVRAQLGDEVMVRKVIKR